MSPASDAASGDATPTGAAVALRFEQIAERLSTSVERELGPLDAVVAVGRGGIVPGALVAFQLRVPLEVVRVAFRDDDHTPSRAQPQVVGRVPDVGGLRIVLVDDVSVTGATLQAARRALAARETVTLVLKGRPEAADVVVFPDIATCVIWPWHAGGGRTVHSSAIGT